MTKGLVCSCGKGYVSLHDNKCGHCRTKKERLALDIAWKKQEKLNQAKQALALLILIKRSR